MSSYQEKLDAAHSIIEEHNSNVEDDLYRLDYEAFVKNLKAIGGTTDKALINCQWEDIESCGVAGNKIPRLLAKQISKVFRKTQDAKPKYVSEKRASLLTTRELLEFYKPREQDAVWQRLKTLSQGEPCIVFKVDGNVHINASATLLDEIREGFEAREVYVVDGRPFTIYRVGEVIDSYVDENPLVPGMALRGSDQTCDKTTRSWKNVAHEVRVGLRLALETGELKIVQLGDMHNVLDALVGKTEDEQRQYLARYPKAGLRYNELEDEGNLPRLKIKRSQLGRKRGRKQDPFFKSQGHRSF